MHRPGQDPDTENINHKNPDEIDVQIVRIVQTPKERRRKFLKSLMIALIAAAFGAVLAVALTSYLQ